MLRILISLSILLLASISLAETRISTGFDYAKGINWNAGLELYLKGTTNLDDSIDLKYGVSEQYDAYRSSPFSFNHSGLRWDLGVLFHLPYNLKMGYTHSGRWNIEGSNTESIYEKHSLDIFTFRKELIF